MSSRHQLARTTHLATQLEGRSAAIAHIAGGARVRLERTWHDEKRTGGQDGHVEGTVAEYTDLRDGTGTLLLTDVPDAMGGYWRAPCSDPDQTTTLDVL
ncbi:hypothetical protein [Amycolatopsis sp. FDAARGOS 1241]|uniref:hypothetical protein n=1 Tax=Amycolatopsis sp. FDAARGOS 1241 TaxID=2778070 RepID=UPI00195240DD|nr:hypothetical protein [Amycolatopsis sp. FDAARGOS 1241]QRP42927.1 hypothetical protein I6J71_26085 [Amycolatopsis sp. FDAARGOS 1241]